MLEDTNSLEAPHMELVGTSGTEPHLSPYWVFVHSLTALDLRSSFLWPHEMKWPRNDHKYDLSRSRTKPTKWCAPSEDADQPRHPHSLISLCCALKVNTRPQRFFMRTTKTLIRLGGCPGWSESAGHTGHFVLLQLISYDYIFSMSKSVFSCVMLHWTSYIQSINEPLHGKTNKMTCAPSEDSDQPGHPPSLISVFAVCSVGS